ncbi:MAG TPA: branched-chain amino acid transport system II carrier protein [Chlamydiales bacterium]|nr:branched-chain amino acid transport system II carrier protein [Chlamydiales bacterium]
MKTKSIIFSTGLAMFSMFFGSGNLVFPLLVGQMSQGHYAMAATGIILTGVFVPFLGIFAMFLFNGDQHEFFGRLGKPAIFWLPLFAISIMGPFGVLARCITVAHGTFLLIFPDTPLWLFSIFACVVLFLLAMRKNTIVPILGSILTPILILSLVAIVFSVITSVEFPVITGGKEAGWTSFKQGVSQGYQTMDLLAAFFFSVFVIKHLKKRTESTENSTRFLSIFLKSSLFGGALLSIIYFFLVLMGSMYAADLVQIPAQKMLGLVAQKALGSIAAPIVCVAVILACMTTAVVLTSLFADFLKKEISKHRISHSVALTTTLVIAFFVSTLEFSGIAKIISPILEICYPALIVLAVLSIFQKLWGWKMLRTPTIITFFLKLLALKS